MADTDTVWEAAKRAVGRPSSTRIGEALNMGGVSSGQSRITDYDPEDLRPEKDPLHKLAADVRRQQPSRRRGGPSLTFG